MRIFYSTIEAENDSEQLVDFLLLVLLAVVGPHGVVNGMAFCRIDAIRVFGLEMP